MKGIDEVDQVNGGASAKKISSMFRGIQEYNQRQGLRRLQPIASPELEVEDETENSFTPIQIVKLDDSKRTQSSIRGRKNRTCQISTSQIWKVLKLVLLASVAMPQFPIVDWPVS